MPGPVTLFTMGAMGAAGAATIINRRMSHDDKELTHGPLSPHALARRRSSGVEPDHLWEARMQPERTWQRSYGANFSHNAGSFPGTSQK